MEIKYNDGEPCNHKGCLSHISHPCEGCGRIAGKGSIIESGKIILQNGSVIIPLETTDIIRGKVRGLIFEKPTCYMPNNDPYPLCLGNNSGECLKCCLFEDMDEDYI